MVEACLLRGVLRKLTEKPAIEAARKKDEEEQRHRRTLEKARAYLPGARDELDALIEDGKEFYRIQALSQAAFKAGELRRGITDMQRQAEHSAAQIGETVPSIDIPIAPT